MILMLLKKFWLNRCRYFRSNWGRILPFGDVIVDRWEKAKVLGFGDRTSIYDSSIVLGEVVVENDVWIGPSTILDGSGGQLFIGAHSCISAGVQIYTHDTVRRTISAGKMERECSPTRIGRKCYIGPYSVITRGVSIGDGCIIGAFSLVNKDIPDGSKAFGVPCKVSGVIDSKVSPGDGCK